MSTPNNKNRGPLLFSAAFTAGAKNWTHPRDESRFLTNDIERLTEFAQIAEKGKFHNIFFVDHLTWFDTFGGDFKSAARHGVNASRIDPASVVVALASHTKSISFAVTFSTISEEPYHLARRIASLDLLTNGRIGWNIVGSFLSSTSENLLNGNPFIEHDERYVRTQEYLDVLYDLFLSSWRDDALIYDKVNKVFADPERIREINHRGKYFKVKGPSITEPTPQRFPVIIQAGTSTKGINFALENAEIIFLGPGTAEKIPNLRRLAKERFNRDPYSIKFIIALSVIVGQTHEEALSKFTEYQNLHDDESALTYFGGFSGFDLSKFDWDEPIEFKTPSNGSQTIVSKLLNLSGEDSNTKTKRKIAQESRNRVPILGTPDEVADKIEKYASEYDLDGFNYFGYEFPNSLNDFVDFVIPELQKRGLAQADYATPEGTFRENVFRTPGRSYLREDHPAYNLRWQAGTSKDDFEKVLAVYKSQRDIRRNNSLSTI